MSRPSVPHYCPNCHKWLLFSPAPADDAPMVGTAKASAITGISERTLRKWCVEGGIPSAERQGGYQTKWILPRAWCLEYVERRRREQGSN